MSWRQNTCCCCVSVKTGTKAIGIFTSICSTLLAIIATAGAILLHFVLTAACKTKYIKDCPHISIVPLWIGAVICLVGVALSVILLLGIEKNKPSYLFPYLVGLVFHLVADAAFAYAFTLNEGSVRIIVFVIIALFCSIAIKLYFFLVVLTYYTELREQLARAQEGTVLQRTYAKTDKSSGFPTVISTSKVTGFEFRIQ